MNDIEKHDYIESIYGCSFFEDTNKVLNLLSDTDELVRIEMIEACYACKQKTIKNKLFHMINFSQGLETGYLLLTLSYLCQEKPEELTYLLDKYIQSNDIYERMDAYASFIILGFDKYLINYLEFLNSKDYTIRCAALNLLSEFVENEILNENQIMGIESIILNMKNNEHTRAVQSSIEHLLEVIVSSRVSKI